MSEFSLWLDYYDDIYSDFDSRHYLKRRISEDFLHELRMARKYKKERATELLLLLPDGKRSDEAEQVIVNSLKDFFKDQFQIHSERYRKKLSAGLFMLVIGLVMMLINSYVSFKAAESFVTSAVKVLLEPGSWFLIWLAFDFLFYDLRDIRKEKDFFNELSAINIHFKSS